MIQLCCFAIGVTLILNVTSQFSKDYTRLAELSAILCISMTALGSISTIVDYVLGNTNTLASSYISTLIKIAGVCFCISVTSDICAQSGYQTLSRIISVAGKAEIIVMVLPYISDMLSQLSQYL